MQILAEIEDSPKATGLRARWVVLWSGPALAGYFDRGPTPVFPRWVGHFAVFVVVMFFVLRNALYRQAVAEGLAR